MTARLASPTQDGVSGFVSSGNFGPTDGQKTWASIDRLKLGMRPKVNFGMSSCIKFDFEAEAERCAAQGIQEKPMN